MLDGQLPPGFEREVIVIRPGGRRTYQSRDWKGAIVSIDSGQILLEREGQPCCRFGPGDLLSLDGLGSIAIRNPGPGPAVLIAVRRTPQQPTETT
jgi:hypothetical protein